MKVDKPDTLEGITVGNDYYEECQQVDEKPIKSSNLWKRIYSDIKDLKLSCVPEVQKEGGMVAFSKHLCGAATDLTLRCINNLKIDSTSLSDVNSTTEKEGGCNFRSVVAVVIALCCHHRCDWKPYVNKQFFITNGFTKEDFEVISKLTSWAVCDPKSTITNNNQEQARNPSENQGSNSEQDQEQEHQHEPVIMNQNMNKIASTFTPEYKKTVGFKCKRLLDYGRIKYMESLGYNISLKYYIDRSVTPENVLFTAVLNNNNEK
eukprot:TRINITY_DN4033_c0_g1_i3.p1 TRINITY_DN4033_c0_g1~~TRINITY_DN4033_c0_g1_i3.p1  ORF type:complete len:263 (-),score=44.45 TRINITY_DN4033_c0_g1_i3:11-799(-)